MGARNKEVMVRVMQGRQAIGSFKKIMRGRSANIKVKWRLKSKGFWQPLPMTETWAMNESQQVKMGSRSELLEKNRVFNKVGQYE